MKLQLNDLHITSQLSLLESENGITREELTTEEFAAMVRACDRMANPYTRVNAELVERPIYVADGVWIWSPTAGATIWLEEYAAKWWRHGSLMYKWAQLYALYHAREPEAFERLTDKFSARLEVVRCALRFPVGGSELQHVMNEAYGVDENEMPKPPKSLADKVKEQAETDFSAMVARLEVESGIYRTEWLWGRSVIYTCKAYAELHAFAAAFTAGDKGARARMLDELDEAVGNLARVKAAIVRRVYEARKNVATTAEKGER